MVGNVAEWVDACEASVGASETIGVSYADLIIHHISAGRGIWLH